MVHSPCPPLFIAATDTVYGTPGSGVVVGLENLLASSIEIFGLTAVMVE